MTREMKLAVLGHLERAGSFVYTRQTLDDMHVTISALVDEIEGATGCRNWILRLFVQKLGI
jgi:hypothetical protein